MHKIKKDDMVKIIAGKDKDKTGKVLSVDTKKNEVVVEGCNMVTKHTKPSQTNQNGGIVHQEAPIDISNVMLFVDGKATRVGFEVKDGKKVRVAKATGKVIDTKEDKRSVIDHCYLTYFISGMVILIFGVILPNLIEERNLSFTAAGGLLSFLAIGNLCSSLVYPVFCGMMSQKTAVVVLAIP